MTEREKKERKNSDSDGEDTSSELLKIKSKEISILYTEIEKLKTKLTRLKSSKSFAKNEIIKLTPYVPREGEETLPLGSSKGAKTLNEIFMETIARVGEEQFYRYNAWSFNCQQFILDLLQTLELDTPEAVAFVKQDIDALVEDLNPRVQQGATELTDIGGAVATIGEELGIFKQGGIVRRKSRKKQNKIYTI